MQLVELLAFGVTMAVGQLTPGPDMLLILKNTLNHGLQRGLVTIAGICTGVVVHVAAVYTGVALLVANSPNLFRWIQWFGAGYLLWVAWQLVRPATASSGERSDVDPKSRSLAKAYWEGLVTNLTNVKVMVLFTSLLAPFAREGTGLPAVYGAIIIAEAALIWPVFCWVMQRPKPQTVFMRHQTRLNGLFALLLVGFAVRLVIVGLPQAGG